MIENETGNAFVLKCLWRGEYGDAELFAKLFSGQVVFSHADNEWYLWNGKYWAVDERKEINNLIPSNVAKYYEDLYHLERKASKEAGDYHDLNAKELHRRTKLLRTLGRTQRVLILVSGIDGMGVTADDWNADPMKLPCVNGVVNLRTGKLETPSPNEYVKFVCPTEFKGLNEPAPRFEQFLDEIFDSNKDIIKFIQTLLGYAISGLSTEHIFPILVGNNGRNGKDTLMEALQYVMGDYASPVGNEVLLSGMSNPNAATPHLVSLQGLRMAWVSETDESAKLNVNQIKLITGGGTISARPLYSKPIKFKPTHTIMLITNFKPQADANDTAFWKRAVLIDFPVEFTDNPHEPNEKKIDRLLHKKLQSEASGILAWLVKGFLVYLKQGLVLPKSIINDVEKYRSNEDAIGAFLLDNTLVFNEYEVKASELYREYADWCHDNGIKALTGIKFADRIKRKYQRKRKGDGYYYVGIGLAEDKKTKEKLF